MSKKTKKNKIISDYRKRLQILEVRERREKEFVEIPVQENIREVKQLSSQKVKRVSEEKVSLTTLEKQELNRNAAFVKKDLKKTIVLSIVGMGILFGLYFIAPF
jgi:hypothetical protein